MKNETEQFFKMPHSLSSNPKLKDGDKLTLALIKSWIDNDQECFMSNQYIGNVLGCSGTAAGISSETIGISSQEIGYVLTDDGVSPDGQGEVSPEVGGIIQSSLLDNLSNNELDNLSNNGLNNEIKKILHQTTGAVIKGIDLKGKVREKILEDFSKYFPTEYEQRDLLFKWIDQSNYKAIINKTKKDITNEQMELFVLCESIDVYKDYPTEELPELLVQYTG